MGFFNFEGKKQKKKSGDRRTNWPHKSFSTRRTTVGIWLNENADFHKREDDYRLTLGWKRKDRDGKRKVGRSVPIAEFRDTVKSLSDAANWLATDSGLPPESRANFERWWAYLRNAVVMMDQPQERETIRPRNANGNDSAK